MVTDNEQMGTIRPRIGRGIYVNNGIIELLYYKLLTRLD